MPSNLAGVPVWEGIRGETQAKLEPLREEMRANRQALRAEMESASPDANRVGERMIAGKFLREQMDQIRGESHARFESILTRGERGRRFD